MLEQGDIGGDYNQNADPEDESKEDESPLHQIGGRLLALAMEAVAAKRMIEQRWYRDVASYNGVYSNEQSYDGDNLLGYQGYENSAPFVNITQPRTNATISRLEDLLLPTDDQNWGIQPTPVPEVEKHMNNQQPVGQTPEGAHVQAADIAKALKLEAETSCAAMQLEIADQLEECNYNGQQRELLRDGCILGTGIMKGPVITSCIQKRWKVQQANGISVRVLDMQLKHKPAAMRVSPWAFFPDMSATKLEDAKYIFERHLMTERQVADLMDLPGFDKEEIQEALISAQTKSPTADYINRLRAMNDDQPAKFEGFEVWEYHGPLTREEMITAGIPEEKIPEMQYRIEAEVWFIGCFVIKAQINPMETGDRPYSVWNYQADEACIFGFGVPWAMRNSQKGVNSAWVMMQDNAALSVGPQTIIDRSIITPANGEWAYEPNKVWYKNGRGGTVKDAFDTFDIPSRLNEITPLFELSMKLVDDETGLPQIVNQEQGMASQSTVGLQAINTSSMAGLRRIVKSFDDNITTPTLERFYDWNMQFSEKEEIKGDYKVDARGSSVLLARDLLAKNLAGLTQVASNPMFGSILKPAVLLRKIVRSMAIPEDVVMTDQEIAEHQQQQAQQHQAEQQKNDAMFQATLQERQSGAARNAAVAQNQQVMGEVAQQKAQQDGQPLPDPGDNIKLEINRIDSAIRSMETQAELTKSQNDLEQARIKAQTTVVGNQQEASITAQENQLEAGRLADSARHQQVELLKLQQAAREAK